MCKSKGIKTALYKPVFACLLFAYFSGQLNLKAQIFGTQTKLEAFKAPAGATVFEGTENIATIQKGVDNSLKVEVLECTDSETSNRVAGITIFIEGVDFRSGHGSTATAFVDEDELPGLIKGVRVVANTDRSITKLDSFTATYWTKGGLHISVSNSVLELQGKATIASADGTTFFLPTSQLQQFSTALSKAKQKLDSLKQGSQ